LRASGASLDQGELEACYGAAWQGLYTVLLEGQEVANPAGWLTVVTQRRAIDTYRARRGAEQEGEELGAGIDAGVVERDLAAELDDRVRLRQLFEGLCQRLSGREREAATLCYLQGLTRTEAAVRLGISEAHMRKLMEGRGPGRPGVAGKVGALVRTIQAGEWCAEQGSLMRAFAYGILDPQGERYRLALAHSDDCPACRAYVASLRGLAAALPPVFLPWGLAGAALAQLGEGAHAAGLAGGASAAGPSTGAGGVASGGGLQAGGRVGSAVSASGAAGAAGASGVAGGGWLAGAGGLGAKLAVGCLLALGAGAGCVALGVGQPAPARAHRHRHLLSARAGAGELLRSTSDLVDGVGQSAVALTPPSAAARGVSAPLNPSQQASREFGPEQALRSSGVGAVAATHRVTIARSASSGSTPSDPSSSSSSSGGSSAAPVGAGRSASPPAEGDSAAAEREFAPG
jgi:hypothetical protein